MEFDPSKTALYHPELQPALLGSEHAWTHQALCAELARLAYWRFEKSGEILDRFTAILLQAQFSKPIVFNNKATSTQCFATMKGDTVYIAFRGTQAGDPTDILIDGMFLPVHWQGPGMVHDGFLRAYNSIATKLSHWLTAFQGHEIYMTGHSLGAALATMAAAHFDHSRLVTFGSPRVGNAKFCAIFANRLVERYVNCADIVTCLPPQSEYYQHVQGMRYIDRHGTLIPSPRTRDMIRDQAIAKAEYLISHCWKSENIGFRSLADHAPINYVRALLNI